MLHDHTFCSVRQRFRVVMSVAIGFFAPLCGAQENSVQALDGTWLTTLIAFDDPRWEIEHHLCGSDCSKAAFAHAQALLGDPRNDDRSLQELKKEVEQYNRELVASLLTTTGADAASGFDQADDPVLRCEPVGFLRQAVAPLPLKIEQGEDTVTLQYEYWNAVRTVYMDGRGHPEDLVSSRLGHSIGWYDDVTLVVETRGFQPNIYMSLAIDGLRNSSHAWSIERYTVSEDGNRLDLEMTIVDPPMLRQPLVLQRSRLRFPDVKLEEFACDAVSGES